MWEDTIINTFGVQSKASSVFFVQRATTAHHIFFFYLHFWSPESEFVFLWVLSMTQNPQYGSIYQPKADFCRLKNPAEGVVSGAILSPFLF